MAVARASKYILAINYENCTGCHQCELACTFKHHKVFTLTLSRITVITKPETQTSIPLYCLQCKDAACARVCPANAIYFDGEVGAYMIDYSRCIGCRECAYACPFGAISFDRDGLPIKCDLCGGDPECVKVCPHDAILYGPENVVMRKIKKGKAAGVVYEIYGKRGEAPRGDVVEKAEEAVKTIYRIWEERKKLNL